MPKEFPHRYEMNLTWQGERTGSLRADPRPAIEGGPPPEFDGTDRVWSPEHLLLAASNLCLMTTFTAIAARSRLEFSRYASRAMGTLDKTEAGVVFTSIDLAVTLEVKAEDEGKARTILEKAKKHCIISNSLKTPVHLTATLETSK
jgi:organic hydroperoxide reductase OsmC/OhrA